jgi:multidrug transporter EmrE-like cation transporter
MNYLFRVFTNIGMISAFLAVLFGAISWIYAMNKLELSSAYPLLSINFIIIPIMSYFLFDESLNAYKLIGIGIIILGLVVFSRGI